MPATCDGDGTHADRAGALHVKRRVADHPDTVELRIAVEVTLHLGEGNAGHVVALEVMIAESAKCELLIDAVMAKLHPGPVAYVAGEKADRHVAAGSQSFQQGSDTGQDLAVVRIQ